MPIVDNAIYVNGVRSEEQPSLDRTFETMREAHGIAWIGLYRPTPEELRAVADEFDLHPLAVEDALLGHQRAKLDRYGDATFVVLRPARYLDEPEEVEFGEIHLFIGPDYAITVRHAERPDLAQVRKRLEHDPELLQQGTDAILYAILDQVVDEYNPVVLGLENDIDEIEEQLFRNDPAVSKRIYALLGEVMEFQRATRPIIEIIEAFQRGLSSRRGHTASKAPEHGDHGQGDDSLELRRALRDVQDHVIKIIERGEGFRVQLQAALTVNSTLVTQAQNEEVQRMTETSLKQNEDVKKISGWAAILFAPSLVGTIYGMNFKHIPELEWSYGYPYALALMVVLAIALYIFFKVRGWM